mmetsp:Transcript_16291/g.40202  ORF Transcript_16291/g.40202 Transcript_16291/m.40202 type:complete len:143 (-) Transcript_16291:623-1051(-)|eukprot:CAMPEP_0178996378 /NCGR_PEP_ID=MMETSP0795-20121207/8337_1 /TAXON_ID=88552 /ORGANISM="Amoebophrya sp., Strain Ameob2" /LENGTH=142 /DNA_ID=CAMNT_0020688765 /DNA_START=106 /DNA_END=534 /DNA_ORIENTATION=-
MAEQYLEKVVATATGVLDFTYMHGKGIAMPGGGVLTYFAMLVATAASAAAIPVLWYVFRRQILALWYADLAVLEAVAGDATSGDDADAPKPSKAKSPKVSKGKSPARSASMKKSTPKSATSMKKGATPRGKSPKSGMKMKMK